MAQAGFVLSDEGRTITAINDSTTTAILAGDPVYLTSSTDRLTGTASSSRAAYGYADIKVKAVKFVNTGYQKPIGIALEDCPASTSTDDKPLAIAMEGVFIHAANSALGCGDLLMFDASTSSKVDKLDTVVNLGVIGSTAASAALKYCVGRALTGASADNKFIIWKLSL